jgi:hypothetical protein
LPPACSATSSSAVPMSLGVSFDEITSDVIAALREKKDALGL